MAAKQNSTKADEPVEVAPEEPKNSEPVEVAPEEPKNSEPVEVAPEEPKVAGDVKTDVIHGNSYVVDPDRGYRRQ